MSHSFQNFRSKFTMIEQKARLSVYVRTHTNRDTKQSDFVRVNAQLRGRTFTLSLTLADNTIWCLKTEVNLIEAEHLGAPVDFSVVILIFRCNWVTEGDQLKTCPELGNNVPYWNYCYFRVFLLLSLNIVLMLFKGENLSFITYLL